MAKERICMICGAEYEWCNTCHDFDPKETWKYLYHDKDCLAISKIWYAYRGGEISKEDAKRLLDRYPDTMSNVLLHTSVAAKEIADIYNTKKINVEEKERIEKENIVEENPTQQNEETQSVEKKFAEQTKPVQQNENKSSKYYGYKNNKTNKNN